MFVSQNHTDQTYNEIIDFPEAQGMPSLLSAAGVILNAQVAAKCQSQRKQNVIPANPFPLGGREVGARDYENLKNAALHSADAARDENLLQADVQTFKAAAIFSSLRLPADFAGPDELGWGPLESSLAAGPSHLIAVSTSSWAALNKAGESLLQCDLADWFAPLVIDDEEMSIFNPKAVYDQHTGRWMIVACAWSESRVFDGLNSSFLIAVSQTRNPTGNWWGWRLNANLNGQDLTTYHATSLGLGLDSHAVYLTANMFDREGSFRYAKLRILDKTPLLTGGEIPWFDFWNLRNPDDTPAFGVRPAHTFRAPGVEYLVNATRDGKTLTLWSLKNLPNAEPQLQRRAISTAEYHLPPNAPQAGTTRELDTGDTRIVNAVFRNGLLYAAHTVAANWEEEENRSAIQWFQINPGAGKIVQHHIFGAQGYDYFCPTVMIDGQNNLVMVFNRSSADEFPAIRFTGRLAIDTQNKLHASSLLKNSIAPGPSAWGGYNGAALDPNDIKVWIIGKYPTAESVGATWIGETSFMSGQPEMKPK